MEACWVSARNNEIEINEVTRDQLEVWWIGHTTKDHDAFHMDIPLRTAIPTIPAATFW